MEQTNIIKAIINFVNNPVSKLKEYSESQNRANSMGGALEEYIKDIFANTVNEKDIVARNKQISQCFSYLGNQNNPPDSIIRGGDAIEVKKIQNLTSGIALNSSYPKAKLFSTSKMITKACKVCEDWDTKDIIYIIGVVKKNVLSNMCMIYGVDFAASEEIYLRIKKAIRKGVNSIQGIDFAETKELGRVNKIDPLGITYLRIRGMWGMSNPLKVYEYIYQRDKNKDLNFMALINDEKYASFDNDDRLLLEQLAQTVQNLNITDVEIYTPDNPAQLKKAKLITYCV